MKSATHSASKGRLTQVEAGNPIDSLYGCLKDFPQDPLGDLEAEHQAEIEADERWRRGTRALVAQRLICLGQTPRLAAGGLVWHARRLLQEAGYQSRASRDFPARKTNKDASNRLAIV